MTLSREKKNSEIYFFCFLILMHPIATQMFLQDRILPITCE